MEPDTKRPWKRKRYLLIHYYLQIVIGKEKISYTEIRIIAFDRL